MGKTVNFQEAVLLNILGFKEKVDKVYDLNDKYSELLEYGKSLCGDDELYAPTYEQAFKWLVTKNAEVFRTLHKLREKLLRETALEKAFIASSKTETNRKNQTKMKNVHLLQTETYLAKLQLDRDYGTLTIFDEPCISNGQDFVGANLYITSDENIKDVRPHKGKWQLEDGLMLNKFPTYLTDLSECKLVIMTTDQNLIADGVQKIDDEFLEWFVQNSSFAIPIVTTTVNGKSLYRTNIGFESWKKEESKQETLLGKTISKKDADKDSFEDVTKYKVERNYSELVDLLERLTTIYREGSDLHQKYDKKRLEFIEQLKNDNENK